LTFLFTSNQLRLTIAACDIQRNGGLFQILSSPLNG
jgi:hypothetical protein